MASLYEACLRNRGTFRLWIINMTEDILYRKIRFGDEDSVFALVKACFDEYVLSDVTEEGASEFFRAARDMIYEKTSAHFILVAESMGDILGVIDIRDNSHICLFFVGKEFQGRGVGRRLLERAVTLCFENNPDCRQIDVNSSLYAVPVYKKFGFVQTKTEQFLNGIRFVPMVKALAG